eukprot:746273-Hanusia_phi.AAC.7
MEVPPTPFSRLISFRVKSHDGEGRNGEAGQPFIPYEIGESGLKNCSDQTTRRVFQYKFKFPLYLCLNYPQVREGYWYANFFPNGFSIFGVGRSDSLAPVEETTPWSHGVVRVNTPLPPIGPRLAWFLSSGGHPPPANPPA